MSDYILIDGDIVSFMPNFGVAVVISRPGKLQGSGPATVNGKKICVDGDEKAVAVSGCVYMTPQYPIPGTGTLKIDGLAANQKATKTTTGGKAVLLKGSTCTAKFEVQSPAQQPTPAGPIPDTTPQYIGGAGTFSTMNAKFQGS